VPRSGDNCEEEGLEVGSENCYRSIIKPFSISVQSIIFAIQPIHFPMRITAFIAIVIALASCTSDRKTLLLLAENSDLTLGKEVKSALALHKADTFRLNLPANSFITGQADQVSVDVVFTILGPDKKEVASVDVSARGPENFQLVAQKEGIYRVVVAPFKEFTGEYIIKLKMAEPLATDPAKRIEQVVAAMIEEDGPGASIAVARDGKIIYSKGFGHAELEHDAHNTPQTIFHIASISKQFTAFSIAMLADQGKLSVDDDIRKYLPEIHDFGTPITIRQLIYHTSGLRDQWNLLVMAGWRMDDVITKNQIMRVISRQRELNFKPGDQHNYCNTGYTLLAEIVSRVSGKPFPEWAKENIFVPLGMNNTLFYDDHERIVPNRAYSYYNDVNGYKKSVLSYANVGATSLFTTVEDLSKWAMNFENTKVGNANVMAMMEQRAILNKGDTISYAFGQEIEKYKGLKTVSHGGADAGYRTFLLRFPDQKFSVSVFSNLASFNTYQLGYTIADAYLADLLKADTIKKQTPPAQEAKPAFDTSTKKLSDYIGRFYSAELETFYEFEVKNDTLVAHHPRHDDFKLVPFKQDAFEAGAWWMGNLQFTRGASNKVNGMKASNGRVMNLVFVKQ
jgi:CubicO group peptidase (beta-lactamase class C family)